MTKDTEGVSNRFYLRFLINMAARTSGRLSVYSVVLLDELSLSATKNVYVVILRPDGVCFSYDEHDERAADDITLGMTLSVDARFC